jgi:hypothetical protein
LDATLGSINPEGLVTGHNAMSILRFLSTFPGMNKFVSSEYMDVLNKEISETNTANVRGPVKKCLTFPRIGFAPWNNIAVSGAMKQRLVDGTKSVLFQFRMVEGKVYAQCISEKTLVQVVYDEVSKEVNLSQFKRNDETCHITIVNSNVVHEKGIEKVNEFLLSHLQTFSIEVGDIKSTFSEDWSRFSNCMVIETHSPVLDKFLCNFNQTFGSNLKPSPHVTFAIQPRNLFPNFKFCLLSQSQEK